MKKSIFLIFLVFPFVLTAQLQNFWTKKNDFGGLKRARAASFVIANHGYLFGGIDTAEIVHKDLWQYDPIADSWTQKADLPGSVRRDAIGFALNDKGYIGTGIDSNEATLGNTLADFWEYNPMTNAWTQKANYPGNGGQGVYFATAFSVDNKGYICGGKVGPNNYSNQLWEYKPSLDVWTQRTNFPGGVRYQLTAFTIQNDAYVGFGADQNIYKKDLWKYSVGTNQWSQRASLPGPERGSTVSFSIGWRGFVCGGTNGGMLDDLWEYNPFSDSWNVRAPYGGSERKNAIAFVLNNKAYVGTGSGFSGKKSSMQEYTPYESVFLSLSEEVLSTFQVFPNPAVNYFEISSQDVDARKVVLYSLSGQKILEENIHLNQPISLENRSIPAGVYILRVQNENGQNLGKAQQLLVQ